MAAWLNAAAVFSLSGVFGFGFYHALECALERHPHLYAHPLRWSNHANSLWLAKELRHRDKPAILFAGSSTTRTGFDEQILDKLTDSSYYVENLSNSSTDPAGIYYWLRYLAKHCPDALPDILIQGIEELELQDEHAYHAFHSHLTRFFSDMDLLDDDPLFAREMRKPWRRRQVWLKSTFPLHSRRTLLQGLVVGTAMRPFYFTWRSRKKRVMGVRWLSRFHLREYTWNYMRHGRPSDEARRMQGLGKLEAAGNFVPERYRDLTQRSTLRVGLGYPNTQSRALRKIAELCAREGIVHYVIIMPGVPEKFDRKFTPDIVQALRSTISEAYRGTPTRLIDAWHFLRGSDFFDSLHIHAGGRGPLTRLVVEQVQHDLKKRKLSSPYRRRDVLEGTPTALYESVFTQKDRARYIVTSDNKRRRKE